VGQGASGASSGGYIIPEIFNDTENLKIPGDHYDVDNESRKSSK
jgi:hypothetical protein